MKAVIMAGGHGTRLRPLTCNTPMPMTEIAGEPAMLHIIRLLKKHGVTEAAVTTMYLPEKTEALGNMAEGVKLTYFREEKPLGTAGSVKRACKNFEQDFIVISGDCICDFDLEKAMEFHKDRESKCTIISTHKKDPSEYGTILCDSRGKIVRFVEKPDWSQVFSGKVNTGVYIISPDIMELVPENTFFDFSKDLFPLILEQGIYTCTVGGYWCDIGNIGEYYRCNFDVAQGRVYGTESTGFVPGASIVNKSSTVSQDARLNECIVHKGVLVESGVSADKAIICADSKIGERTVIGRGAVIGENCIIGKNSVIGTGVRIFSDIILPPNSNITRDVVKGNGVEDVFCESGVCGNLKGNMSPEKCFVLGSSCVIKNGASVGVMSKEGDGTMGEMLRNCVINGVVYGGGKAVDFGTGNRLMSAYASSEYGTDITLYIHLSDDDGICIFPVGGDSLSLGGEVRRKIRFAFNGGEAQCGDFCEEPTVITGIKQHYLNSLVKKNVSLEGLNCAVCDTNEGEILGTALKMMGADVTLCTREQIKRETRLGKICFEVTGETLNFYIEELQADFDHIRALLIDFCDGEMKRIALPYSAPLVFERIARVHEIESFRYLSAPVSRVDRKARSIASHKEQLILRDGCFAAVRLCEIFSSMKFEKGKIRSAFAKLPMFFCLVRDIKYNSDDRAQVMERLSSNPKPDSEGARIMFEHGNALVIPGGRGGFRIISEGLNAEMAQEISFETERKIYGKEE
ncbi:MAG: NTP transferase domain-containing protein [Clostridia bacterium]|nr:NTP transferase domain-containing protein [Clostridia bacterium]